MTTTVLNRKISEVENKISNHDKYITTLALEFNRLTAERLTQANLLSKNDFDNKIISFNRKITSDKTKYLEVKKKMLKQSKAKQSNNKRL